MVYFKISTFSHSTYNNCVQISTTDIKPRPSNSEEMGIQSSALDFFRQLDSVENVKIPEDTNLSSLITQVHDNYEAKWCCIGKEIDNLLHIAGLPSERRAVKKLYTSLLSKIEQGFLQDIDNAYVKNLISQLDEINKQLQELRESNRSLCDVESVQKELSQLVKYYSEESSLLDPVEVKPIDSEKVQKSINKAVKQLKQDYATCLQKFMQRPEYEKNSTDGIQFSMKSSALQKELNKRFI